MAKNVVITGATSGIGEAIARAYLEKGENIVLTGRRIERLEALKAEFGISTVFHDDHKDIADMFFIICKNHSFLLFQTC